MNSLVRDNIGNELFSGIFSIYFSFFANELIFITETENKQEDFFDDTTKRCCHFAGVFLFRKLRSLADFF